MKLWQYMALGVLAGWGLTALAVLAALVVLAILDHTPTTPEVIVLMVLVPAFIGAGIGWTHFTENKRGT